MFTQNFIKLNAADYELLFWQKKILFSLPRAIKITA